MEIRCACDLSHDMTWAFSFKEGWREGGEKSAQAMCVYVVEVGLAAQDTFLRLFRSGGDVGSGVAA